MKIELIKFLEKNIEIKLDFESLLEKPKLNGHGDFSLPVFSLAKEYKKAPNVIANELCEKLSKKIPKFLEKITAAGPYVNFY